jgi:tRNA(Arg) A34 adenosine deaminase TadA
MEKFLFTLGLLLPKNGKIIAKAHRGQYGFGEHAEYTVLERVLEHKDRDYLKGATLYTTFEPCVIGSHWIFSASRQNALILAVKDGKKVSLLTVDREIKKWSKDKVIPLGRRNTIVLANAMCPKI